MSAVTRDERPAATTGGQIGSYEAKTHLPRLLDEVEAGATYTITKHGRPVARLVPMGPRRRSADEIRARLATFRASVGPQAVSIDEAKQEGQR